MKAVISASAYYTEQAQIMREMQSIISKRTAANGQQITEQLAALQRRAFPEFYRGEPQPIGTTPEQISTERQGLTFLQMTIGLYYYCTKPIRRAQMRRKARKGTA